MKIIKFITLIFFSIDVFSASLTQVLSSPEKFENKKIQLSGVYCAKKDLILIYPSKEFCLLNQVDYGIGLILPHYYYVKREEYGHKRPIRIKGIVHIRKQGEIKPYAIYLSDVEFEFIQSYPVEEFLNEVKGKTRDSLVSFSNSWIRAVKMKNDIEILRGLGQLGSEIENTQRANWVLFKAKNSIFNIDVSDKNIQVYSYFDHEYDLLRNVVCYMSSNKLISKSSDIPEPLELENEFCLVLIASEHAVFVDASWLLY